MLTQVESYFCVSKMGTQVLCPLLYQQAASCCQDLAQKEKLVEVGETE